MCVRVQFLYMGLLSTSAFMLAKALKNTLLDVLVRAKGHGSSFPSEVWVLAVVNGDRL